MSMKLIAHFISTAYLLAATTIIATLVLFTTDSGLSPLQLFSALEDVVVRRGCLHFPRFFLVSGKQPQLLLASISMTNKSFNH